MCFYFSVFTELFSSYQSIFVQCWPLILVLLSFCSLSFQTCCSRWWLRALSSVVLCLGKDLLCSSYSVQNKQRCSDALLTIIEPFLELLHILNSYAHVSNLQTCQNKEVSQLLSFVWERFWAACSQIHFYCLIHAERNKTKKNTLYHHPWSVFGSRGRTAFIPSSSVSLTDLVQHYSEVYLVKGWQPQMYRWQPHWKHHEAGKQPASFFTIAFAGAIRPVTGGRSHTTPSCLFSCWMLVTTTFSVV